MKTLTKNNLSLYLLEDDVAVEITSTHTFIGIPPGIFVSDCKTENVILHENVTAPDKWDSSKYFYANGEWTINPSYVEPPIPTNTSGTQDL